MNIEILYSLQNKLATVWIGQVMFPGKVTTVSDNGNDSYIIIESHQHKGIKFTVQASSITAVSVDENTDTVEKFEAAKKAAEEKQKAAADEYRRLAEEMRASER